MDLTDRFDTVNLKSFVSYIFAFELSLNLNYNMRLLIFDEVMDLEKNYELSGS